ncbi:hypothetical protein C1H46_021351 [Malus baccata]|uniref:Uncharacterized protein n=1 Tax=Malus baccata TaxID=106549 RepID=A0A540M2R1_MALBA|nr:hypothetical protein C1H46_021351 [Malus baccata]
MILKLKTTRLAWPLRKDDTLKSENNTKIKDCGYCQRSVVALATIKANQHDFQISISFFVVV